MQRISIAWLLAASLFIGCNAGKGGDLFTLCVTGDSVQIAKLLTSDIELEARNDSGLTVLLVAAKSNPHPSALRALIEAGADMNATDSLKQNAVWYAAQYNANPEITMLLLDVKYEYKDLHDIFIVAAKTCNKALIKLLVQEYEYDLKNNGAIYDKQDMHPIMHAAKNCEDPEIIDLLIAAGQSATMGRGNGSGTTSLMFAAAYNPNPEVLKTLIKHGADVNDMDYYEQNLSVLGYAVKNPNPEIAKALIEAGAIDRLMEETFNALCENGTPEEVRKAATEIPEALKADLLSEGLEKAVWENEDINVSKALCELGAKSDFALLFAVQKSAELTELLLQNGADPNYDHGNRTGTILNYAADTKDARIIPMLIKAGANVNQSSELSGETPLMEAAFRQNTMVVKQLLEAGADPNAQTYLGTALHRNEWSRDMAIVKLLIEHGADPTIKNKDGKTKLDLIREQNSTLERWIVSEDPAFVKQREEHQKWLKVGKETERYLLEVMAKTN